MVLFIFETQRRGYWVSLASCFVLLGALCCCNGLPHQETYRTADLLRSASVNNVAATEDRLLTTSAGSPAPTAATQPYSNHSQTAAAELLPIANRHTLLPDATFVCCLHATATGDHMTTSTAAATATPALAHSTSTSTAATLFDPKGCNYTQLPNATAVSFFQNLSTEEKGRRLIQAAEHGATQDMRTLLAVGADVRARDERELTALHLAALGGHVEVARCLLQAGAEVDARDSGCYTPLHRAAGSGHPAVVRLLLMANADPNARSGSGWLPLHWAARWGNAESAALLLEAGTDREARDESGRTALDVAREFNQQQLIQMLQENVSSNNQFTTITNKYLL